MESYLKKLEYDKILNKLKDFAITDFAKNKILTLKPSFNEDLVTTYLNETNEGLNFILRNIWF